MLVSLELSSTGFTIGLMVNFGIGGGSTVFCIGLIVSFGNTWSLLDEVEDTTEESDGSREFVLIVSLGSGGSGIGLMVNLTPSLLVKTGVVDTSGFGIALICSFNGLSGFSEALW